MAHCETRYHETNTAVAVITGACLAHGRFVCGDCLSTFAAKPAKYTVNAL